MESELNDCNQVIANFKADDKWLVSSTAINVYATLLNAYNTTQVDPLFFIVDTFVYVTCVKDGEYKARKFKKMLPENITKFVTLLFPVNVDNNHWILIQVNTQWLSIVIMDSLSSAKNSYRPIVNNIIRIVKGMYESNMDLNYDEHAFIADCPQQPNGYDCGMYVLNFAEQIIRKKKIAQFDAKRYRKLVLRRIESDKLLIEEKIKFSK
jgi:sentrin-specific protease 1